MKKREIKNGKKTEVIISEATDGVNKVRLIGSARAEEEECPWEEIDAYSGRFVMAGHRYESPDDTTDRYHPWLAYSTDGGKTWEKSETTSDENQPHGYLHALAYGGGRFVVAGWRYSSTTTGDDYHPWLAYSTDGGKTWEKSETTSNEDQTHGRLRALAYGGGRFVVAGYRYNPGDSDISDHYHPWLAYSTDGGETWTPSDTTQDQDQPHGELYALAYGGGRFVVAGFRYEYNLYADNIFHPWLAWSADGGKTWEKSETTSNEDQPHGYLYALTYGGGRFVVAGYRYNIPSTDGYHPWLAWSADGGKTWTPSDTTSDENQVHGHLRALTYGGGRFVVAGYRYGSGSASSNNYHPWLAWSADGGETWTKSDTTSEEDQVHGDLRALAYGGGRFVVAGWRYGNTTGDSDTSNYYHPWLAYSTDGGKTWTPSDTTSNVEQPHGLLYALAYAPDSYCWKFGKEEEEETGA